MAKSDRRDNDSVVTIEDRRIALGAGALGDVLDEAEVARHVFTAAAAAIDLGLSERIRTDRRWRVNCVELVNEIVRRAARSRAESNAVAHAALQAVAEHLPRLHDHSPVVGNDCALWAGTTAPTTELVVPYGDASLRGAALLSQLHRWVAAGIAEPSFAVAIERVVDHPEWLRLPGRQVAVLGASSSLSPLAPLSRWGADILAIDDTSASSWQRMATTVREGAGLVKVPVRRDGTFGVDPGAGLAGWHTWLSRHIDHRPTVIGVYADTPNLRTSASVDDVAARLLTANPDSALAYLGASVESAATRISPEAIQDRIGDAGPIVEQLHRHRGPAAMLAGRIPRWRALVSAQHGRTVSFNVAPPSFAGGSDNVVLAGARRGVRHLGVEILPADTVQFLMAGLLVHDLHQPPPSATLHPEGMFTEQALHGGLWRCGPVLRRLLPAAASFGLITR